MATFTLQHVQPGDLITAELMNKFIDALQSLDLRVDDLESGEVDRPPVLVGRTPTGDVETGSLLTLLGRNFLRPSNLNTVMLDNVPINSFGSASDDTKLVVTIPDVFSSLPRTMLATVTNKVGTSAPLQVRVLPHIQIQGGDVVIFSQTPPLGVINAGASFDLLWAVDSQTILPAVYNFSLIFTDVVGASLTAWQAAAHITPSGSREITRGSPLIVTARVTVPTGATSVQVALKAESTDQAFSKTSDPLSINVGQIAVVTDPRASLTIADIPPADPVTGVSPNPMRLGTIDPKSGIELKFGTTGHLPINMHVTSNPTASGLYVFSAIVEDAAGLWVAGPVAPAQTGPATPAPSNLDITVTIQNTDAAHSSAVKFMVVRATHRTSAGADDFISFLRFPIRGFAG